MIKKTLLISFLFSLILVLNSCSSSLLMPYAEDFGCRKDPTNGYCGSISQVYKQSFIEQKITKE